MTAIHNSPAWERGRNAIVMLWDENDYSLAQPEPGACHRRHQLRAPGRTSAKYYTHFSLTRTLEAGFGLPCLNHACDDGVHTMSDLFGGDHD